MFDDYHPIYLYMYEIEVYNQRTPRYTVLDPKLAVESVYPISEVPGASKAHLDVVNGPVP